MTILTLVKRNMLLFFKDKSAVFFSLMAVFVVIGLYVAFLGDLMIQPLEDILGDQAREVSDVWIMAGTLGTVCLTTSLSVLEIIIDDKKHHIRDDFLITPMKKQNLTIAYFISTFLITFSICMVTLLIAQLYITYYGGHWMTVKAFLQVLGILGVDIFCCISILYFFLSFFHSTHAFSNVTTIIGTLSGFLMGIYIPMGTLPSPLQTLIRIFPPSHGAALLRKVMMEEPLQRIFADLPPSLLADFRCHFGLDFYYYDVLCTNSWNFIILIVTAFLFLLFIRFKKKK